MAYYKWDRGTRKGAQLDAGMENFRSAMHILADQLGAMQQMSDAQIATEYGFADATVAGNAKAELAADFGKLLTDASQTGVNAALLQMLNQFA